MTEDEIQQTADLLKRFEPGFLPYPVFEQVARIVALPIVEFVPLRRGSDGIEVLLLARPDDDPLWPGLLNTPGTVVRATDFGAQQSEWPPFYRIIHEELLGTELSTPHYVGSTLNKSKRGVEQSQLYWVEVRGEPRVGKFYPVTDLPQSLMASQATFISEAVRNYAAS
ncbi:MAG: hypothetical protein ABIS48_02320 [Candidatus Saccharimonadales bacterium]